MAIATNSLSIKATNTLSPPITTLSLAGLVNQPLPQKCGAGLYGQCSLALCVCGGGGVELIYALTSLQHMGLYMAWRNTVDVKILNRVN